MPSKNSFQASKYTLHSMLLTKEELEIVAPVGKYVILGKVLKDPVITREEFLGMYEKGRIDALGLALSLDHFAFIPVPGRGVIAKIAKPVIEIKPFAFMITSSGELLENIFGKGAIDFGISFSYPLLFQEEDEVVKTRGRYLEWDIFENIKAFKRGKTAPAQFMLNERRLNGAFRIGKNARALAKQKISSVNDLTLRGGDV